jgi:predicted DNA-binding transcriptional regulator YafY
VLRANAPALIPAAALAERFETSVRTIERDISALQQAGVPIWAQTGPGGGYGVDPTHTLPPLNLTVDEAAALAVALAESGDLPWSVAATSAARKLAAALDHTTRDRLVELASRIRVTRPEDTTAEPSMTQELTRAVAQCLVVQLTYRDRNDHTSRRSVEAHGLYRGHNHWYLIGWCRLRQDGRLFRLDRIVDLEVTGESAGDRDVDAVLGWVPDPTIAPGLDHHGSGARRTDHTPDRAAPGRMGRAGGERGGGAAGQQRGTAG